MRSSARCRLVTRAGQTVATWPTWGCFRAARGRGIAKSLLHTVIADAARRGRDRVDLEVDADSPTGADGLYRAMGFVIAYETQSWHVDVPVPGSVAS